MLSVYSVSGLSAKAVSYGAIQVLWTNPTTGSTLRLVRNSYGTPAFESDGVVLLQQGIDGNPSYLDTSISPESAGQFIYYTVWNQDSNGQWWRGADVEAILPKDWGYWTMLQSWLPSWYFSYDSLFYGGTP